MAVAYPRAIPHCIPRILFAFATFAAVTSFASEIKLATGLIYKDVTILHRDDRAIEFKVEFGTITVALPNIESIDGKPVGKVAAFLSAHQTVIPSAEPAQPPVGVSGTTSAPAQSAPGIASFFSSSASSTAVATGTSNPETSAPDQAPASNEWPQYTHRWGMDLVLLGVAAFSALWLASVGRVQSNLFEQRRDPRFWLNTAVALPGLGYLLYAISENLGNLIRSLRGGRSPRNVNETVAERERATRASRDRRGFEFLDQERKAILIKDKSQMSGIETAQDILEEALLERASDVHIDPAEEEYRIRFRIDGLMHARMTYERNEGLRLVSALKTLAEIDVAEKRKAQDGRFRVRKGNDEVDFRVATTNSIFGEKLVIRILDRKASLLGLGELGMQPAMSEELARVTHSSNGMILATGPTGSGKTSTLYSALSKIDAARLNILTIEDPVEYELEGATQIPVNVKAGVTYESGLRSLLRQDPDVILVGEMRDKEAAQIALRAALTGHLLFSSLHSKSAIGTIIRLEEMGIERHLLSSALLVVLAQRLVRVLCPACREPYPSHGNELAEIGVELPKSRTFFRAKGCEKCLETGYVGRTGVFEMIVFDEDLRQAVNSGMGEQELTQLARTKGYRSYREEGADKIVLGITSVEEILQAT